jgi:3-hydroxybutyryl-CoA dehydrogenase
MGCRAVACGRNGPPVKAAILGAGVMGRNIAKVLLRGGHDVSLFSRTEQTLLDARRLLEREAATRIAYTTSVTIASAGARLVIESVPESLALKLEVLRQVEAVASPQLVIATNTSSLPLTAMGEALARPDRFLGLHWFNPAHLIPLVEVVPIEATDPAVIDWSVTLLSDLGKRPLVLSRPVAGFLANRLQYALIREALQLLDDGVATAEQIDAVITDCLGPRWAVLGPMHSTDLAGVRTAVAVARELFPTLSNAGAPQPPLTDLLAAGRLGVASGAGFFTYPDSHGVAQTRDRRLSAVLGALAEAKA